MRDDHGAAVKGPEPTCPEGALSLTAARGGRERGGGGVAQ